MVSIIKRGLTAYGFEVSVAANGATDLQMVLGHDFDPVMLRTL